MPPLDPVLDPVLALADLFRAAIARAYPDAADADPVITQSKQPKLGDFQCNAAMALAKRVGKNPREVAAAIVASLPPSDLIEPLKPESIAGPGFINIRLRAEGLVSLLEMLDSPSLGVRAPDRSQTVVVDLMGVNLAKQMHVGHLRSPFIGDAIARTLERLGHKVIRQNHVGDWGLPIAMVVTRIKSDADSGRIDLARLTLDDLDVAYKDAQAECQRDMAGLEAARRWHMGPKALAELEEQVAGATEAFARAKETLLRLQAHDPSVYPVWQRIADITMAVCLDSCKRLHVNCTAEHSAGESSYAAELPGLVEDLVKRGIAIEDQGALIVRLDEPPAGPDGQPLWEPIREPCLVRKSDGGYLYATTDLAGIRRRVQKFKADRLVYAIDARQGLHMKQVFGASTKAGYATNPATGRIAVMQHAAFGTILGEDGQPFKTRTGDSVKLADLLEETAQRALADVRSRSPEMLEAQAREIAEAVGMAALKYADLSIERTRDYIFSFDRMLADKGDTGVYLLYALARVRSIFRKAAERGLLPARHSTLGDQPFSLAEPAERALALALLRYPGALEATASALAPHILCGLLFDVASTFAVFFDQCPVLTAPDDATRLSRLRLADLAGRILADGLATLGIPTLERM
jgi:arginyl-tRNA synthetase